MTTTAETTTYTGLNTAGPSTSIAALWPEWLAATAAYHAAMATDPQAAQRAYGAAEILALRLAAIPARIMDDTQPKVIIAAWQRQYPSHTCSYADIMTELAIAADLDYLQQPLA